jgi:diguanylate cyclase (GGDEF)-like protein
VTNFATARALALFEGPVRVWAFIAVLAAATAAIWGHALQTLPAAHAGGVSLSWWQLAVAFYLAEVFAVHLLFRKQAHTLSLTEVGLVLGLFFTSPLTLLVAQVVGAALALAVNRRQRPVKLAFNVVELSLCTGIALLVFRALAAPGDTSVRAWLVAILAAGVAHTTGVLLISAVIGIAERRLEAPQLGRTLAVSLFATTATACLGLAAVELVQTKPIALVLLTIPVAACVLAFRGYMAQREQREHVEFLYQSMRATHGAPEFGLAVGQLLVAARRLLRAEYAEILLVSPGGSPPVRSVSGPDGELLMHHEPVYDPIDVAALERAGAAGATLLSKRRQPDVLDGFVASRDLPDAIVGPLRGENGVFGLMLVGERGGDISTFSATDLDLFETFAGHASVLLENGRLEHSLAQVTELKEQLRHQAYHDWLTGLPNRVHFVEEVADSLAASSPESPVAVLYLDLDRFKTVNDSWGHAAGDELLVEVARRIRHTLRPGDLPARLGGDEFAVLLRDTDAAEAELVAGRVTGALDRRFTLSSGATTVHGSIGIAVSGPAGRTADDLIRSADIAMYSAKAAKERFAVYEPRAHSRLRREHRPALDLELALDRDDWRSASAWSGWRSTTCAAWSRRGRSASG